MTSRTTDLIAIGIVVVASLSLGRQVRQWWHAAPPVVETAGESPANGVRWADATQPVTLEFGDVPLAMTRQAVPGGRDAAVAVLVRACQRAAKAAHGPWRERDAAEEWLLDKTAGLKPVAEEQGVWQAYLFDERFPMVAGVRRFAARAGEPASGGRRLVCWGTAMPAQAKIWTAYLFEAVRTAGSAGPGNFDPPLPPGARRNLSLRDERGGAFVGFSGAGTAPQWMKFFDGWFVANGWSSGAGWLTGSGVWSARFDLRGRPGAGRIEVQFAEDARGELSGLLRVVERGGE